MGQDVQGVVHLNVHVVADGRQFLTLVADHSLAVFVHQLPARATFLGEPALDDDRLTIFIGFISFRALVLDGKRDFRGTVMIYERETTKKGAYIYLVPSRMKLFSPLPRPVEFVLPPRARVRPESTALFPPKRSYKTIAFDSGGPTYSRCDLSSVNQHENLLCCVNAAHQ